MKIIIDGYNLLRSPFVSKLTVERLIHFLKRYSNQKGHTIVLVFDGGDASWPYAVYQDSIKLIYSGHKSTADTVIKGLISEECKGKECLIVSSDREIGVYAQKNNIVSIEVDTFYSILKQRIFPLPQVQKIQRSAIKRVGYESSAELDALMERSKDFHKKEDEEEELFERSLSRQEKKLTEILKKL